VKRYPIPDVLMDSEIVNSMENSMKKEYGLYEVVILVVCCIAMHYISCHIEKHGFETVDRYSLGMGYGLCLRDGLLYATTNDGVELYEIGTGGKLKHIQSIDLGAASFTVLVKDSISFVGGESGLTILELSDNDSLRMVGRCSTAGTFIHKIGLIDNLLYISDFYKGLSVVDISDPENPHSVDHHDLATGSWDLEIAGDVLYLANAAIGLMVFDITDPTQPRHIGVSESSGGSRSILIIQDTLYLGTIGGGLKLYDLVEARNPSLVRGMFDSEEIYAFHAGNGMLYCSQPERGITIYKIGDGADPTEVAFFNTGLCHDALVHDSLICFIGKNIYVLKHVP
jgi:hypothetical protein